MTESQSEHPAASTTLTLVPPSPVPAVSQQDAANTVQLPPEQAEKIDAMVNGFVEQVTGLDVHSPDFAGKVDAVHRMGDEEVRQSASVSNRLLDKPVKAMSAGGFDAGAKVSRSLIDLRHQIEDLDPAKQNLLEPSRLLGILPFGNRLRDYFARYQSAQSHINAIVQALYEGQDELRRDNAALEQEKVNIWALKGRLEQYAYMAGRLDAAIEAKAASFDATDPDRARTLREDVLFYVRQKRQDLLTQLAVNIQGYLAMELVRKNNLELIKGVDRATTTTVSALRTAVIVAQALTNQRLVLSQVTALNTTTGNLIESTSELLREQSGLIHEQAASSTIQIEKLQAAFQNIYVTMDMIDAFKLQALGSMQKTVDALSGEVGKAQSYLERARGAPAGEVAIGASGGDLALPEVR